MSDFLPRVQSMPTRSAEPVRSLPKHPSGESQAKPTQIDSSTHHPVIFKAAEKQIQRSHSQFFGQSVKESVSTPASLVTEATAQGLEQSINQIAPERLRSLSHSLSAYRPQALAEPSLSQAPVKAVLALGDDATVRGSAESIAAKPGHSRIQPAGLKNLGDQDKLTLVGHGDTSRFGGKSPAELADFLKQSGIVSLAKISLKGCNSTGFAEDLMRALQTPDAQGRTVAVSEISGRDGEVSIVKQGQDRGRTLVSRDGQTLHQAQGSKTTVRADGSLISHYAQNTPNSVALRSAQLQAQGTSGQLKLPALAQENFERVMDGFNSGNAQYLRGRLEAVVEHLSSKPHGEAIGALTQLSKAIEQATGSRRISDELRSICGKNGLKHLAQALPAQKGKSSLDFSPPSSPLTASTDPPPQLSAQEKLEVSKAFIERFDEVVIYVPNTPNYGIQSITTRMIHDIRENLKVDKPLIIATPESEIQPWEQTVKLKVQVPEGEKFDQEAFYHHFASSGGQSKDYIVDDKNNDILLKKNVSGQPTHILELDDYITAGNENARIVEAPDSIDLSRQTRRASDSNMQTITFEFTLRQPEVLTTADKVRELAPELADNPNVIFSDIASLGQSNKRTLLLSGPRDDSGRIDSNGNNQVTQIFLPDKDHHPEKRRVFSEGREFSFPDRIDAGARFPVRIDPAAIEKSDLEPQAKLNLAALITQAPKMVYAYGFHQVPVDKREALFTGLVKGSASINQEAKRPVVFIAGAQNIPDVPDGEQIQLTDPNLGARLLEQTTQALVIRAGKIPADVNDLIMSKASLVLAEGKGSISKCQELGIRHLILPQSGDENNPYVLKTEYHQADAQFAPKVASLALYDNPSQTIASYLNGDHTHSYQNMVSPQNLLTESLSLISHSLFHFKRVESA